MKINKRLLFPQHTRNSMPLQTQELHLPRSEAETSMLESNRTAGKMLMTRLMPPKHKRSLSKVFVRDYDYTFASYFSPW